MGEELMMPVAVPVKHLKGKALSWAVAKGLAGERLVEEITGSPEDGYRFTFRGPLGEVYDELLHDDFVVAATIMKEHVQGLIAVDGKTDHYLCWGEETGPMEAQHGGTHEQAIFRYFVSRNGDRAGVPLGIAREEGLV